MIVVAIIGLIAAMGVPSILQIFRKEGMRKAVSDVKDVFAEARAQAILKNQKTASFFIRRSAGLKWRARREA